MRLLRQYITLCMIQFARVVYIVYVHLSSTFLLTFAQHLWTQYRLGDFVWCFVSDCFARLTEVQVSGIMLSSEIVPQDAHTKVHFVLTLSLWLQC